MNGRSNTDQGSHGRSGCVVHETGAGKLLNILSTVIKTPKHRAAKGVAIGDENSTNSELKENPKTLSPAPGITSTFWIVRIGGRTVVLTNFCLCYAEEIFGAH